MPTLRFTAAVLITAALAGPLLADSVSRVFDLNPGTGIGVSDVRNSAVELHGQLYFAGESSSNNYELWRYDGVDPPTLAADINPSAGSIPQELVAFGDRVCFTAHDASLDREPYCYDGSNPPVKLDVKPGTTSSTPTNYIVFQDELYFAAQGDANGKELWRYDGANPPVRVTDLAPGSGSAFNNDLNADMLVWRGLLYFVADDGTGDRELYSYDGVAPPLKISDSPGDAVADKMVRAGRYLYFAHGTSDVGGVDVLWRYDGVNPPEVISETLDLQGDLASFAGSVYMWAFETAPGSETSTEMWGYDGVTLWRVAPGVGTGLGLPSWQVYAGALYFLNNSSLYRYDGSGPPVKPAPPFLPLNGFVPIAGRLFLAASSSASDGGEVWALVPSSPTIFNDGFDTAAGAFVWSDAAGLDD